MSKPKVNAIVNSITLARAGIGTGPSPEDVQSVLLRVQDPMKKLTLLSWAGLLTLADVPAPEPEPEPVVEDPFEIKSLRKAAHAIVDSRVAELAATNGIGVRQAASRLARAVKNETGDETATAYNLVLGLLVAAGETA